MEDQEDPNDFRHLSSISRSLPGLDSKMKGQCYNCQDEEDDISWCRFSNFKNPSNEFKAGLKEMSPKEFRAELQEVGLVAPSRRSSHMSSGPVAQDMDNRAGPFSITN